MMSGRRWRRVLGVALFLGVGLGGFLWVAAGRIASPARREVQEYHRSYLDGAEDHGLVVSRHACLDGMVPVLVAVADGVAGPAERGRTLRRQMEEREMAPGDYGAGLGVVVLLHGRNGRKEDMLPVAERFCAAGLVCVMPDLPSHGESPVVTVGFGALEFEKTIPGKVVDELELGGLPQYLWGMSMGGSFAIHAADLEPERWKAMVIVSSFDTLGGVIEDSWAGVFRPVFDPMVRARGGAEVEQVRPVDLVGGLKIPALFVHGDADELIGLERGQALHAAHGGEKKLMVVEGGTHANVLVTEAPVYVEMVGWLMNSD